MLQGWESKKRAAGQRQTYIWTEYTVAMEAAALAGKVSGAGGRGIHDFRRATG
jgi:galactokinase/mevalonate kinase-like predicted kinase